ncbi:flagellar export chaperone FliS [Methylotenera sp.]|uniref:flagellar export chaperone FliS n=1 Tax=Methylotenera sp. TaxID=2051956 RepID=UPI002488B1D1|nr:flagellar export chaperone FliS [Methylotenera sp.]MDI1299332.1 flagellar export chaperone FliS [Methylotenera sp.]
MFGSNQHGVNVYAKIGLETGVLAASPNKLIIMLYDGAITASHSAIIHMQNKDISNKGAMISKAISIIESGLRLSLDKKAGGEIAVSLDALYAYMSKRLMTANIQNKPELIHEVIKLLTDLKGAWEAIDQLKTPTTEMPMATSSQVAMTVNRNIANYAKA